MTSVSANILNDCVRKTLKQTVDQPNTCRMSVSHFTEAEYHSIYASDKLPLTPNISQANLGGAGTISVHVTTHWTVLS